MFSRHSSQQWFLDPDRVKVPVFLGQTSSEFTASPPAKTWDELVTFARQTYGEEADRFLACFTPEGDAQQIAAQGCVHCIDFAIRAAAETNPDCRFYVYNFDAHIPGWDRPGTFHSVDLWFFFETLAKCWRSFTGVHYDLARQMCDYWCNFMREGDPNGRDCQGQVLPEWPAYDPDMPMRMVFTDKAAPEHCEPDPLTAFLLEQYLIHHAR